MDPAFASTQPASKTSAAYMHLLANSKGATISQAGGRERWKKMQLIQQCKNVIQNRRLMLNSGDSTFRPVVDQKPKGTAPGGTSGRESGWLLLPQS